MDEFAAEFPYEPTPDQCQVYLNQMLLFVLLKNLPFTFLIFSKFVQTEKLQLSFH